MTPSFFRNASGSVEHVPLIKVNNLSRALTQIQNKGVIVWGLSEEEDSEDTLIPEKFCIVAGSEDRGLSHAVRRILDRSVALQPLGR